MAQRDTSKTDSGVPSEQKGNAPSWPQTRAGERETLCAYLPPTDLPWAIQQPLASQASACSSVPGAPILSSSSG